MVLPTSPPNTMDVGTNIYVEFGIPASTLKYISRDLFPLVGGPESTLCYLGASFSGKRRVTYLGSSKIDGTGNEYVRGIACDGSGNVYVVGEYGTLSARISNFGVNPSGTAGTLPSTAAGLASAFIAKWNASGTYLGSAYVNGTVADIGYGIACDVSGNVYISGSYGSSTATATITNFGVNPSGTAGTLPVTAGSAGAFIAKWNASGTYLGSAKVDGASADTGRSVACDVSGNVYVGGQYGTSAATISNFGVNPSGTAGTLPATAGAGAFVAKWNASGTYLGSAKVDGTATDIGYGVACDGSSNVYLVGEYGTALATITNFGVNPSGTAGTLPATAGLASAFIAKWNASGTYINSAYVNGTGNEGGYGVACDGSSNVYLVGEYGTALATITNFGVNPSGTAGTLPATAGLASAFIAKWNASGTYLGSAYVNGTAADIGRSVACDVSGNVYVGGEYGSVTATATITNFGVNPSGTAGTLPVTAGSYGAFIARWNASGTYLGSAKVDGAGGDVGNAVACDGSSNVYLGGYYGASAATITNFGVNPSGTAGTLSATGGLGAFIAKWSV